MDRQVLVDRVAALKAALQAASDSFQLGGSDSIAGVATALFDVSLAKFEGEALALLTELAVVVTSDSFGVPSPSAPASGPLAGMAGRFDGPGFIPSCPDCGERGERRGHQTCQYPSEGGAA